MVCLACQRFSTQRVCPVCTRTMRPAPDRLLDGGIRLVAAFEHEGAARTLVHHLKYRGVTSYARLVARLLEPRLPRLPLVPVPRAMSRRLRYGVDPARVIAGFLAEHLEAPVLDALNPQIHTPRRAGRDHSRPVRPFGLRSALRSSVILVDDVVTTGATVSAAMDAIGPDLVRVVVAANVVPHVSRVTAL